PLPCEMIDEGGDFAAEHGTRRDDRGAVRLALGDRARVALREKRIQLLLGHAEQLLNIIRHGVPDPGFWFGPRRNRSRIGFGTAPVRSGTILAQPCRWLKDNPPLNRPAPALLPEHRSFPCGR